MKNKNQKRIHQTPKIEIRGGRKVKDFRKTKILDSKENLEIDLQTDDTKETESQAGLLKLLERITNLALNLQKEVAELKEDTLVNASHIILLGKEIRVIRKSLQDFNRATYDFTDGLEKLIGNLENKIQCLSVQSESQAQKLEKIKFCMEVFSSHISILEKRSKRWTDRLRLGSFKIKSIEEEKALKQHIAEISKAKTHFD